MSLKKYLKNGDGKVNQEIPTSIREDNLIIGMEWKSINIIDLIDSLPMYSPFTDCSDYYFDLDEMEKFINFTISECVFPEGENAGLPFIPEKWQWAIFLNIFCWKHKKTNRRRYREAFIYIPRKNGKTSAFGVIPTLYMFYADGEKRSQNFCCAADVEQAAVNFRHVSYNIEQNPRLLGRLHNERVNRSVKTFEHKDGSMFKVLSSIAETKHGLSPNFVYVDEVHAHRSGELIDVMVTGTAGRSQPLIVYTTTADFDRVSVCNDMYARAKSIALGQREEATFLPVIYEASVDEDFNSYNVWVKANPNFGVSIYPEYFERQIQICRSNPSLLNRFLRLHLNIRTKTETVWIPPWVWANGTTVEDPLLSVEDIKCKINQFKHWHNYSYTREWTASKESETYINDFRNYYTWYFRKLEELRHSEAWGGYDNTASSDIASFVLYFPTEGIVLPWFWVPAESISRRSIEERIPYDRWHKAGLINNTPLACISEIDIGRALTGSELGPGICEYFTDIRNVSYDRWGSNFVYETLYNYGVTARPYPQSFAAMNEPCRKLETMITNSELFHGGNPILDWMMNNSMITINNNNQKRVDKNKSTDKVDGIVAFLMAIGGHIYTENNVINSLPGLDDELV